MPSEHIENLCWMAKSDPPSGLTEPDAAKGYALNVDFWTSPNEYGDHVLGAASEIYWRTTLGDAARQRVAGLLAKYEPAIRPPDVIQVPGGWGVSLWIVAKKQLVQRALTVARTGEVLREDTVCEDHIPVYLGKLWKQVDGRLVPSG